MRVAVNTISVKRHSGGAYQIAYNFLMKTLQCVEEVEWFYITSEDVDELVGNQFETLKGSRYFVFPTQPAFRSSYWRVKKEIAAWEKTYKPDVIYSISSPCYLSFKSTEVMRFANAWVTNPNKESWHSMPFLERVEMWLYCLNQKRMLRGAKYIITQSETVKIGLIRLLKLPEDHVGVVPNVLPQVFQTETVNRVSEEGWIDIACVAAPVPHKNLVIIPEVLKNLKEQYQLDNVRFHLTIPEGDATLGKVLKGCQKNGQEDRIVNHGRCTQKQLCNVYNKCSVCFLPSLLETFSASSLEAMYFGLGIVATDFGFNREVIDDAGLYYDPLDAVDAARCIHSYVTNTDLQNELGKRMQQRLSIYSSYEKHFRGILGFLKNVANKR